MSNDFVEGFTWRQMWSRNWTQRCGYRGGRLTVAAYREITGQHSVNHHLFRVTGLKCRNNDCVGSLPDTSHSRR
jgi:hypothetical protein